MMTTISSSILRGGLIAVGLTFAMIAALSVAWRDGDPQWDFRDLDVSLWEATGDIQSVRRVSDGMEVVASGPLPTLVAPKVGFGAKGTAYVRLRVRSPEAIDEAYLGWSAVDQSGREATSTLGVAIPQEIRGGIARTVWVRVADSPAWSGDIRRLGLVLAIDGPSRPFILESIGVFSSTWWVLAQRAWTTAGLDIVSGWMASQGSMMSVGYIPRTDESFRYPAIPREGWTVHGYAGLAVLLGLGLVGIASRVRTSAVAGIITRLGYALIATVVTLLVVLATAIEFSVWEMERTLFGGLPPEQVYAAAGGPDAIRLADDLKRVLPEGAAVALCLSGERWSDEALFWPIRYHVYPIPVEPEGPQTFPTGKGHFTAHYLLVLSQTPATCSASERKLFVKNSRYSLYRPL